MLAGSLAFQRQKYPFALVRMGDATERLLLLERLLGTRVNVGKSNENHLPKERLLKRSVPWMLFIEVVVHAEILPSNRRSASGPIAAI